MLMFLEVIPWLINCFLICQSICLQCVYSLYRIYVLTYLYIALFAVIIFGLRFAFFTHISGKNAQFQNMCAKNAMIFDNYKKFKIILCGCWCMFESKRVSLCCLSNLQWSNFRVEKCKTEEYLSKFLNNMAYKTVTSMRECVIKRNFM